MFRQAGLLLIILSMNSFAQNVPVIDLTDGQKTIVRPDTPKKLSLEEQVFILVNDHRAKLGLRQLINHAGIAKVAQSHSQDMADKEVAFGHGGWRERFKETRRAFNNGKDKGNLVGENVAFGQETAQDVFDAWIESDEHREAIEEPKFTHTGIGIAKRDGYKNWRGVYIEERTYWTQLFLQDPDLYEKETLAKKKISDPDDEEEE